MGQAFSGGVVPHFHLKELVADVVTCAGNEVGVDVTGVALQKENAVSVR